MNDSSPFKQLREASWRRDLTPAEEAQLRSFLAAHPEAHAEWDSEEALNQALKQLPRTPVSSNFTARVLQAAQLEKAAARRRQDSSRGFRLWRARWLPRITVASVAMMLLFTAIHQDRQVGRRRQIGFSVRTVSEVSALASPESPEIFADFEAIQAMSHTPAPDKDLLRLLQ